MKIVINTCFGGFQLSNAAQAEYLKMHGKEAFFYRQSKYKHSDGVNGYYKVSAEESGSFCHTITKDMGEKFEGDIGDEHYWYYGDLERTDADLIAVVEALGGKANGSCSRLRVVEIPDDVEYEIAEYDGNEHIAESHRTWS